MHLIYIFYFISSVSTLTLKLDGTLEMGPNWQYEYKFDVQDENNAVRRAKNDFINSEHTVGFELFNADPSTSEDEESLKKSKYHTKISTQGLEILKEDFNGNSSNNDSDDDDKYRIKNVTKHLTEAIKSTKESFNSVRQQVSNKNDDVLKNVVNNKTQFGFDIPEIPGLLDTLKEEAEKKVKDKAKEIAKEKGKEIVAEIVKDEVNNKLNQLKKPAQQWAQNLKNDSENAIKDKINGIIFNVMNISQSLLAKVPFQSNTHKIADDVLINSFRKEILERTLKLFKNVAKKSTEYHWKKRIRHISRSYEDKFNEFLRATKQHAVKSRWGPRKVILNAIDESNRIVTRLFNYVSHDMERKGLIYNNLTANILRMELNKEENTTFKKACEELGICRNQKGFNEFLFDIFNIMLSATDSKFKSAFKAMTKAAQRTDFSLGNKTNNDLITKVIFAETQSVKVQRGIVMIIKNIIAHRNIPLAMYNTSDSDYNKMESTLALLDIINTLDANVPNNAENLREWDVIRRDLEDCLKDKNVDINDTMAKLMANIQNTLKNIDHLSRAVISYNAKLLLK